MRARLIDSAGRAAVLARRTAALFPVRVWRRFLRRNGFLLSAGMAYQSVFALFALLYVALAIAGVWVGGSDEAVDALVEIVNRYLPGFFGEGGVATRAELHEIVASASTVFTATGLIATVVAMWTAVGAVTFTRRAVRGIFGLPFDTHSFILLKFRDAVAAVVFGVTLLAGAAISVGGVWALAQLVDLLGWGLDGGAYYLLVRSVSVLVVVAIDATAIAVLVRFLTDISIPWRTIWPGATLGGIVVAALQLGIGLLFARTPGNPLLATFAVMVALLLWCRLIAAVILLAASWIAVSAHDRDQPLEPEAEAAATRRLLEEAEQAARERLDAAQQALARSRWWRRKEAKTEVLVAAENWEDAAAQLAAFPPPEPRRRVLR